MQSGRLPIRLPNLSTPLAVTDAAPVPVDAGYTVIYARRAAAAPLSWAGRLVAAGVAGACLTVLLLAAGLTPNPSGCGTHRGLGLTECGFLAQFGLPCPACGMTTSFAWFVRGNLAASLYVQPMGTVLAVICAAAVWGGGYVAATGRPLHKLAGIVPDRWYLVPLLSLAVAAWAWKMFIHLHGIDGWR